MRNYVPDRIRWLFPFALVIFELVVYFSIDMYLPALPDVQQWFSTSEQYIQLTLSAWLVGSGTFQLLLGPISDRFGRRRILLGGCIVFIATSIGCALTDSLSFFVGLRLIQGTVVCCVLVAGYACINELLSSTQAIKTLARMNSVTVLAPAIGPIL